MKKLILILMVGSLFADSKLGFGFAFDAGNPIMRLPNVTGGLTTSGLSPTIYFPQDLPFGKVEPSISYYRRKYIEDDIEYNNNFGLDTVYTNKDESIYAIGVGFIDNQSSYEKYNTYFGIRISALMSSDESNDNIYLFSPLLGAEYYFSERFSLGGEGRLNYAFDNSKEENRIIEFSTHLFFRFYK